MMKKVRVNITVDKDKLEKAKKKLHLFGGKLSTLFNAYLADFVKSIDRKISDEVNLKSRVRELELRIKKIERRIEKD